MKKKARKISKFVENENLIKYFNFKKVMGSSCWLRHLILIPACEVRVLPPQPHIAFNVKIDSSSESSPTNDLMVFMEVLIFNLQKDVTKNLVSS